MSWPASGAGQRRRGSGRLSWALKGLPLALAQAGRHLGAVPGGARTGRRGTATTYRALITPHIHPIGFEGSAGPGTFFWSSSNAWAGHGVSAHARFAVLPGGGSGALSSTPPPGDRIIASPVFAASGPGGSTGFLVSPRDGHGRRVQATVVQHRHYRILIREGPSNCIRWWWRRTTIRARALAGPHAEEFLGLDRPCHPTGNPGLWTLSHPNPGQWEGVSRRHCAALAFSINLPDYVIRLHYPVPTLCRFSTWLGTPCASGCPEQSGEVVRGDASQFAGPHAASTRTTQTSWLLGWLPRSLPGPSG